MWPSGVVRHQYRAQGKRSQEDRVHLPPLLKIGRTWSPGSQHSGPPAAAPGPRKGLLQQDFGSQTPKKMPPRRLGRRGGNDGNTGHVGPRPTSRRASTGQPWPGEALQLPNHPWLGRPIKRVREDRGPFAAILGNGEHGAEARVSGAQVADPWLLASSAVVRVPPAHHCDVHLSAGSASRGVQAVGRCVAAKACRARRQRSAASGWTRSCSRFHAPGSVSSR